MTMVRALVLAAVVVLLALAPYSALSFGGLLPGAVNSTGSLQLLALMFVAAATAITLDLMFGYTGLLSFGHALYFGFGCYSTVILSNISGLGFTLGLPLAMLLTFMVALVGNAASLRLTGIGFSMATLALAQALAIAVERGFLRSGGEVGVTYGLDVLPAPFVGIANTRNAYWLALALLVAVYAVVAFAVRTEAGHIWQAIRENPCGPACSATTSTPASWPRAPSPARSRACAVPSTPSSWAAPIRASWSWGTPCRSS